MLVWAVGLPEQTPEVRPTKQCRAERAWQLGQRWEQVGSWGQSQPLSLRSAFHQPRNSPSWVVILLTVAMNDKGFKVLRVNPSHVSPGSLSFNVFFCFFFARASRESSRQLNAQNEGFDGE